MTLSEAKEHYQSKVPRFREEFRRRLDEIRDYHSVRNFLFTARFPTAIEAEAQDEVRRRHREAHDSLERALDAGWTPESEGYSLNGEYAEVFGHFSDPNRDSDGDINVAMTAALASIGQTDDVRCEWFRQRIQKVRNDAATESIASLKVHIVKEDKSGGTHYHGPVGAVLHGHHNTANVTTLHVDTLVFALAKLVEEAARQGAAAREVADIARDAEAEVKTSGFTQRAQDLLLGLAVAVQTTGALAPAYELVRIAAAAAGHHIPDLPKP